MQSSATEPGSIALSILLWETQKEWGPSMRLRSWHNLVPISSVFRGNACHQTSLPARHNKHVVRGKIIPKTYKQITCWVWRGLHEWRMRLSFQTFNLPDHLRNFNTGSAFAIKRIHSTFHNRQNCQKMTRYLWTCVHTHIHTSDLFFQNSFLYIHVG